MSDAGILTARVDREDRLVDADADFAALNTRAGGGTGQLLAVPQLATIVRLARRLRILVARGVTIADGEKDVDCWVRATPGEHGVTIAVSPLRERPAWCAPAAATADVAPPPGADWIWETDAALNVMRVPAEAAARHGFDSAVVLGRPLTTLFVLENDDDGALPILDAVAARRDFTDQPATLRPTGRRYLIAAVARRDASGAFAGFVGGAFVSTEPTREDAPLSAAFSRRLEPILRGPLGRIIANADSINAATDGPLDPHYVDYAADIASAGRHLMGLVDDLADIEAIERPDFAPAPDEIDLADVVRRAAGLLGVRAADAGVTIDRGATDRPLPATAEFRRTLQILVNLIGNAVRYSPRGSTLRLSLAREGNRAVVTVEDEGKGIAPNDQARIFEKFERVDAGEPGGSGLGLYIARRLARAMGGDLTVESVSGQGARFMLALPAR
ncbi:HAMP domain-containing histidine kinase [Sphingomonas sp. SUN019]|uniref:PAS domain-containing sensor histidine kinase n=1 Tax=Sphingomonas sp. SUN019 TaxID=2937788 RepID=UPI002164ADF4|nr:HAMP domain-containing sensor histidine kinase [Sphingomonas sp. SUN019]UVO52158.1 HAMP domain-containing histidine kinase [Sphingomonas sp. SUN019]